MSVYNGLPYLEAAVMSILNQIYTDFEFIILDDGSIDNTWGILQEYAQRDSRIRLFSNQRNLGYTRTLNEGFKQARAGNLLTPHLSRLKSRVISQLHISEVFAATRQNRYSSVSKHLLPGIQANPAWLLNRGVLSMLFKRYIQMQS